MVSTNYGKTQLTLAMVGSMTAQPQWLGIGEGSGTVTVNRSGLYNEVSTRKIWSSRDISTDRKIVFTYDRSTTDMSGISLTEFMIGGSEAINSGDAWNIENFNAINFDGSIEAQIEIEYEVF